MAGGICIAPQDLQGLEHWPFCELKGDVVGAHLIA